MRHILAIALITACSATPAFAQTDRINSLSSASVRDFIVSMTDKTKPGSRLSDEAVLKYLETHLADGGSYNSNVTFRMKGFPDQVQQMTLTKESFIENVMNGRAVMKDYMSNVSVKDVDIDRKRDIATFTTETRESGIMPLGTGTLVPFRGNSTCKQEIYMNGNTPQISAADCKSTMEIIPELR